MEIAGLYILSYLVGAVPTAFIMGKLVKGVDIRGYGSGNVGGTNVFHHVGKGWAMLLGVFEILVKGALPVYIGDHVLGLERSSPLLIGAPLLAIAGHNWSPYLKFQGGRGIGVVIGTLLALSPLLLVAFMVIAVSGWAVTRSSGVWVLISLVLLPAWAVLVGDPVVISFYCTGLLGLIVVKRLLSNWTPMPEGLPKERVLFNRLFRDRDVDDHAEWVQRVPHGTK
jgi:glycerol-3-phosphate acyltransferase PlsY